MTSDVVYKIIQYATAKNLQTGYVSPDDFNTVLMPVAQSSYLDYLLGEYQKYTPGRPQAVVEFSGNQKIRQSLAPLIYGTVLSPNTTTGIAPFPSDFEQTDAMWSQYNIYRIRFTTQDALFSTYRSAIDPIVTNPIYVVNNDGFQFYPENITKARLSYVRTPPPITWGYSLDSNGIPVYNPATSQQPVWSDYDMYNVIVRALQLVGVNLQLGVVMQYAEQIKQGGQ